MTAASGAEAFHYDPASNLLGAAPSLNDVQAWKASGDRLLRFAPQTRPDRPVDFTYDGHGNRIARTVPLPPKPELTAAEQRSQRGTDNLLRVMEVLTGTPKYEEPTEAPEVTRYRYDGSHQLIAIEHADGAKSEYEYDALGRRVAKHQMQSGGARHTTLFMWDGDWMMQEVHAGRTSHEDNAVTYVPHPDHEGPLTRLADGQAWHYVTDHLGTPQELYDEQREVVWAADLSAYGRSARTLAHDVDNPIRFPGQYYDRESGLHYNRFRYYDPQTGRYINQDPIGLVGGINSYTYSDNQPSHSIDLLGLHTVTIGAIGGGAVAGPPGAVIGAILGGIALVAGAAWYAMSGAMDNASEHAKADCSSNSRSDKPDPCDELQKKVRQAKDHMGRTYRRGEAVCTESMSSSQLRQRLSDWLNLAIARAQRDKKCFEGGDVNHQMEQATAWRQVSNCQGLLRGRL
ncbi:RHS repeat-associated core domain-containing protein [Burkholderia contaminans]